MSCSHVRSWKVKLKLVTDSWRNSHSPCVLITSRENCVARVELEKGMSRISSTEVRGEKPDLKEVKVKKNITQTSVQSHVTHTSSLTTVHCRSDGDVASLCVKGELVDVHLTGADHLNVLFRTDYPIMRHEHVGIQRGVILLYPETSHKIFSWHVLSI